MIDDAETSFSVEVGRRLRAVRRQRRWSLEDVERASNGRWSASAIGAYERGYRNLSLPRLQELAEFYRVPMGRLLGEDKPAANGTPEKIVLDLAALEDADEARPVASYARAIVRERGDIETTVLSIRRDDVRALASIVDVSEGEIVGRLRGWGVLAD